MKKSTLLFILLSICGFKAQAQNDTLANRGFENWQEISTQKKEDPINWRSINVLLPDSVERGIRKSTDAYEGNYSLELFPVLPVLGKDSALTAICLGSPLLRNGMKEKDYIKVSGLPFNHFGPFIKLNGYYKYKPSESSKDSAYAQVSLKDVSSLGGNMMMAFGQSGFTPQEEWTPFTVNVKPVATANSDGMADSIVVLFFYKSNNKLAEGTGRLLIDDLSLDLSTGLEELAPERKVFMCPNPTNTNFTFYQNGNNITKIVMVDVLGRFMKEITLTAEISQTVIDVSNLSTGVYQIRCLDEKGDIIDTKPLVIN